MVRVTFALLISIFSSQAHAIFCHAGDTYVGGGFRVEYQNCTTSGYCNAYDYNPSTGQYEYFYGFHSSCPGRQERRIEDIQCQRPDGFRYTLTDYGWWSGCQVN